MTLYRVIVLHGAPKGSHKATEAYLIVEEEEQVADWINKERRYGDWFEDSDSEYYLPGEDGGEKEVSFREWVLANKGDLEDESGWEDAHYGVTKYGWEKVHGANPEDFARLLEMKIAVRA